MSTSATITFVDDTAGKVSIYSHGDGYPSGITEMIEKAKKLAWDLPRFEADEFAAAFIAANKDRAGGFRIISNPKRYSVEYHYVIELKNGVLYATGYKFGADDKRKALNKGPVASMLGWND
jgi:hypothetical protein